MRVIHVVRKPLGQTVALCAEEHATGSLNLAASSPDTKRHPANLILTEEIAQALDAEVGTLKSGLMRQEVKGRSYNVYGQQYDRFVTTHGDEGGPSRFFKVVQSQS